MARTSNQIQPPSWKMSMALTSAQLQLVDDFLERPNCKVLVWVLVVPITSPCDEMGLGELNSRKVTTSSLPLDIKFFLLIVWRSGKKVSGFPLCYAVPVLGLPSGTALGPAFKVVPSSPQPGFFNVFLLCLFPSGLMICFMCVFFFFLCVFVHFPRMTQVVHFFNGKRALVRRFGSSW